MYKKKSGMIYIMLFFLLKIFHLQKNIFFHPNV